MDIRKIELKRSNQLSKLIPINKRPFLPIPTRPLMIRPFHVKIEAKDRTLAEEDYQNVIYLKKATGYNTQLFKFEYISINLNQVVGWGILEETKQKKKDLLSRIFN